MLEEHGKEYPTPILSALQEYRKDHPAPVDTMGCAELRDRTTSLPSQRFQILLSLMLSSQTRDVVTSAVMRRLFKKYYPLSPATLCDVDVMDLEKDLVGVSFHRTKAKHIKKTVGILIEKYGGDIPPNASEMEDLPGIGPKMSMLCMQHAWNKVVGIGVDTHVHRVSNRLGWVKTKTPDQTKRALEAWIPREEWGRINVILVGHGQTLCRAKNPICDRCPVSKDCMYFASLQKNQHQN